MRKHHLLLQVKKAKRKFGDAEAHVGCTCAHLMRCGFVCSEESLWSPHPASIKSGKRNYSKIYHAVADEYALLGSVYEQTRLNIPEHTIDYRPILVYVEMALLRNARVHIIVLHRCFLNLNPTSQYI
ncbi:hypothetical protein BDR07DRAFT_1427128 [Suillus spraguei]|nr:hypothetical protein BDR07DRAFT_1427128 [Suillus spraguei]